VTVATPVLPESLPAPERAARLRSLIDALVCDEEGLIAWYYTPMWLGPTRHLAAAVCVYDCMDELSAFRNPPPDLGRFEERLFERADLVFTGGYSLFEAKRRRHPQVFAFPSSVDAAHFGAARRPRRDPEDQAPIGHPRIGFFGVIDERMDLDLVARTAEAMPDCRFVMLGPVVKIDPGVLPQAPNLHWLGRKDYAELPGYLANWSAGWMPFALNEATRFISPTKTPEFLAAGLQVTATAVADVVRGYGTSGLVRIADAASMPARLRDALRRPSDEWRRRVEKHLATQSWDRTWSEMRDHVRRIDLTRQRLHRKGA
jgi:glycosyltransferase involved in cell wall biosynthesis